MKYYLKNHLRAYLDYGLSKIMVIKAYIRDYIRAIFKVLHKGLPRDLLKLGDT
jgi:hypothetical protein